MVYVSLIATTKKKPLINIKERKRNKSKSTTTKISTNHKDKDRKKQNSCKTENNYHEDTTK